MKALIGTDLKRFLRNYKRRNRPSRSVSILLQSVEYPANVGSIFRLAEGAGVEELILTGITPTPPHPTIDKIGRFKSKKVSWRFYDSPLEGVDYAKGKNLQVIALELTDRSTPYFEFEYAEKICLVAGHEDHGVTRSTLDKCDASVFIPMYGKGRSHNVQTALAIVLYHILHDQQLTPHP